MVTITFDAAVRNEKTQLVCVIDRWRGLRETHESFLSVLDPEQTTMTV